MCQVKYFVEQGYFYFMYDFCGYGESDFGLNLWCIWGLDEVKDVLGVVDYVCNCFEFVNVFVGFLFFCMGLVLIIYVYGLKDGFVENLQIKVFVVVQFLFYDYFVDVFGMSGFICWFVDKVIMKCLGFDLMELNFINDVLKVSVLMLVIQNINDLWIYIFMIYGYYNVLIVEKDLKFLEFEESCFVVYDWVGKNFVEVEVWFVKFM